jgi:hypothetical protein
MNRWRRNDVATVALYVDSSEPSNIRPTWHAAIAGMPEELMRPAAACV